MAIVQGSAAGTAAGTRTTTYRHSVIVRITHWIGVLCMAALWWLAGLLHYRPPAQASA